MGSFNCLVLNPANLNGAVQSFCDCRTRICNSQSHFYRLSFAKTLRGQSRRVTMLQDHPHAIHFKQILYFGEGHGFPLRDGTRKTRTDSVSHFVTYTPVECGCLSIEAKVVSVQCDGLRQRSDAVYAPESGSVIGCIVKKSWLLQVWARGEAVNLPRTHTGLNLEAVKARGRDAKRLRLRPLEAAKTGGSPRCTSNCRLSPANVLLEAQCQAASSCKTAWSASGQVGQLPLADLRASN